MSREFLGIEFVVRARKLHKEYVELYKGIGDNKNRWDNMYIIGVEEDGIQINEKLYKELVELEIIEHKELVESGYSDDQYNGLLQGYVGDLGFCALERKNNNESNS